MMDTHGKLVISSHNICGFNNSREFLLEQCNKKDVFILALQEHWLHPPYRKSHGTDKLKLLHPDYDAYAVSGMQKRMNDQIIRGRPYGGTGFLYAREMSRAIRPKMESMHERVSVLELKTDNYDILLVNAYFPYYNVSRLQE